LQKAAAGAASLLFLHITCHEGCFRAAVKTQEPMQKKKQKRHYATNEHHTDFEHPSQKLGMMTQKTALETRACGRSQ